MTNMANKSAAEQRLEELSSIQRFLAGSDNDREAAFWVIVRSAIDELVEGEKETLLYAVLRKLIEVEADRDRYQAQIEALSALGVLPISAADVLVQTSGGAG
jgi:hypothetical protein